MRKMGSLPNLHELGKEESSRTCSSMSQPHSYPIQNVSGEDKHRSLHRHSTHCRNKTNRNCVQNQNRIVCDDFTLEQMATYSPISSSRSTRNLAHGVRRRDSLSSSIGATSVRRLIAVVRGGQPGKCGPVYSRRALVRNLVVLSLSHFLLTSTLLPFLTLQASVSTWSLQPDPHLGSLLLTLLHFFAAISTLIGPTLVQRVGPNSAILTGYGCFGLFYGAHLYPALYVLLPVYALVGVALGPLSMARVNFLMTVSAKLSYAYAEEDEDAKFLRRTTVVRRVARTFQAAQDLGLIFGSVLSAVLITYTYSVSVSGTGSGGGGGGFSASNCTNASICDACGSSNSSSSSSSNNGKNCSSAAGFYDPNGYLDAIFDVDELGDRLCGSQACPNAFLVLNESEVEVHRALSDTTAAVLAGVYLGLSVLAMVLAAAGLDRIRMFVAQDPLERAEGLAALRAVKDTFKDAKLQLAAPLALFIGVEQAFMYADFGKSYVVCTLGIHRLNLVFLCMGLLQSIAACTLSMLLRTIRRYYVIAVGFAFHACLLMVQMLWKPIGDDPALFYVISAAWGVCNAIWEMLNFTLLTGLYADNWEAAFANSLALRNLGMAVAFLLHGFLCNWLKLYLLAFLMLFAAVPFAWLEVRLENIRKVKNISRL